MTDIELRAEPLLSPLAQALIGELNAELSARYPEEGANHFRLDAEDVADGQGAFLVAYLGGEPVACGAVRRNADGAAEIKRMYTRPAARGRGVATALLLALEGKAGDLGVARIVLETGERQPEALALYRRAGFVEIPCFGEYIDSPLSLCMGKDLP